MLIDMAEDPEVLCARSQRFQFVACNIAPMQDCYSVLKALKLDIDLAALWTEDLSDICFQSREISSI